MNRKLNTLSLLLSVDADDVLLSLKNIPFFSDKNIYKFYKGIGSLWYEDLNSDNIVLQQREFDLKIQLPGYIIPIIERSSMNASLEVRSPFLSKDLVEYTSNIDYRSLFKDRQKDVLRRITERYLPTSLIDNPKKGFSAPGDVLINNAYSNHILEHGESKELKYAKSNMKMDARWSKYVIRLLMKEYYNSKIN